MKKRIRKSFSPLFLNFFLHLSTFLLVYYHLPTPLSHEVSPGWQQWTPNRPPWLPFSSTIHPSTASEQSLQTWVRSTTMTSYCILNEIQSLYHGLYHACSDSRLPFWPWTSFPLLWSHPKHPAWFLFCIWASLGTCHSLFLKSSFSSSSHSLVILIPLGVCLNDTRSEKPSLSNFSKFLPTPTVIIEIMTVTGDNLGSTYHVAGQRFQCFT